MDAKLTLQNKHSMLCINCQVYFAKKRICGSSYAAGLRAVQVGKSRVRQPRGRRKARGRMPCGRRLLPDGTNSAEMRAFPYFGERKTAESSLNFLAISRVSGIINTYAAMDAAASGGGLRAGRRILKRWETGILCRLAG
ncbi:MAG: hypothetical protein ACLT3G_02695 [Acutalibacteraceae bacterium]